MIRKRKQINRLMWTKLRFRISIPYEVILGETDCLANNEVLHRVAYLIMDALELFVKDLKFLENLPDKLIIGGNKP